MDSYGYMVSASFLCLESYTVGSNEFCMGYSVQHQKLITIGMLSNACLSP